MTFDMITPCYMHSSFKMPPEPHSSLIVNSSWPFICNQTLNKPLSYIYTSLLQTGDLFIVVRRCTTSSIPNCLYSKLILVVLILFSHRYLFFISVPNLRPHKLFGHSTTSIHNNPLRIINYLRHLIISSPFSHMNHRRIPLPVSLSL